MEAALLRCSRASLSSASAMSARCATTLGLPLAAAPPPVAGAPRPPPRARSGVDGVSCRRRDLRLASHRRSWVAGRRATAMDQHRSRCAVECRTWTEDEPWRRSLSSHVPARRGTGFRWTIHADVACPRISPRPEPSPARERARVEFPFSPHTHSLKRQGWPHYLILPSSTSSNKVGLKHGYDMMDAEQTQTERHRQEDKAAPTPSPHLIPL